MPIFYLLFVVDVDNVSGALSPVSFVFFENFSEIDDISGLRHAYS